MKNELKIDIGCGGRGTKFDDFIGIDVHPKPPVIRNALARSHLFDTDAVLDELPFEDGSVDLITCFHVIEHFDGTRIVNGRRAQIFDDGYLEAMTLFIKIERLLKFGGKAFITCPDSLLFAEHYIQASRSLEPSPSTEFFKRKYKSGVEMWRGDTFLKRFFVSMIDRKAHGHRTPYDLETLLKTATQVIEGRNIEIMPDQHRWRLRDHEVGIIITKQK